MRWNRVPKLLLPLALAGALAAVGGADDAKTEQGTAITLPGPATCGVVRGDHFYTVARGGLVDVDLKRHKATTFQECYAELPKLKPFIDVAERKVCVASDDYLYVLDPGQQTVVYSAAYKGEVHGLGFAGGNRVFVVDRRSVKVIDAATGETLVAVPILNDEQNGRPARTLGVYQRRGDLLYVTDNEQMCVQVVDLKAGKLLEPAALGHEWITGLQVVGDKAFIRSALNSYGIYFSELACYDLKAKKYTALRKESSFDRNEAISHDRLEELTLVDGPDGGVCLSAKGNVSQYDAEGRRIGETPLATGDDGRLVGVWNGEALTAGKDSLRLTPLAKATAKGE